MAFDWSTARRIGDLFDFMDDDAGKKEPAAPGSEGTPGGGSKAPGYRGTPGTDGQMPGTKENRRPDFIDTIDNFLNPKVHNQAPGTEGTTGEEPVDHFEDIIKEVISEEGNYVNNKRDPGGPTKYGIALNYNEEILEDMGIPLTADGIKEMTYEQAQQIYREKYWDASRAGKLPEGAQFDYFTAYINSPRRAVKALQKAIGAKADGAFGKKTEEALEAAIADQGADAIGSLIKKEYVYSLAGTKNWDEFGNGWANRYLETDVFGKGKDKINIGAMSKKDAIKEMDTVVAAR